MLLLLCVHALRTSYKKSAHNIDIQLQQAITYCQNTHLCDEQKLKRTIGLHKILRAH